MSSKEFKAMIAKRNGKKSPKRANVLTNSVLTYLNSSGYKVSRNNTTGIFDPARAARLLAAYARCIARGGNTPPDITKLTGKQIRKGNVDLKDIQKILRGCFRKHHGIKGVPDIVGYEKKTGKYIGIEIKAGKDKESVRQRIYREEANKHGALCVTVRNMEDLIIYLEKSR